MNSQDIKFSELFFNKHGKRIYESITKIIKNEKLDKYDNDDYIEVIFKVAFMSYFGLDSNALNKMLEDINCITDIQTIKKIHRKSIGTIQKYIKDARKT